MTVPMNSGRDLDTAFKAIVAAGWAMKSDGNVEAPTGYFAKIPISKEELPELMDAVFGHVDDPDEVTIEPGYYVTKENSDGIIWIWKYNAKFLMDSHYASLEREYAEWSADAYVLTCHECGKRFEDSEDAHKHAVESQKNHSWLITFTIDLVESGV